jgi:alpha-L-fucosidase
VEQSLNQLADWIAIHGEAIYSTRPWLVYGEGPVQAKGGHFREDFAYTAKDVRFTTRGKNLYAFALGWPADGKFVVRSLSKSPESGVNQIKRVELLGRKGSLRFTQTEEALTVEVPGAPVSELTCALRIQGVNLKPINRPPAPLVTFPDTQGRLTLSADEAQLHGDQVNVESRDGQPNIGFWDKPEEWVSWRPSCSRPAASN